MMLQKELTRGAVLTGLGFIISVSFYLDGVRGATVLLPPFMALGTFYAAKTLFKLIGCVFKAFFSGTLMIFLFNPFWGTLVCLTLLLFGLMLIIMFGWILGLVKYILFLIEDYRIDRQF